ncbi:hypothetical protein [Shouchella miscanthi]|uniref:Uncharacterized protein n=1 Tax=Shouchella miscanthi TaxID=2598861 RepID=A0ABU6NPS6_9BACI|nr:hypothetical protein [Shouchella miscanthi]
MKKQSCEKDLFDLEIAKETEDPIVLTVRTLLFTKMVKKILHKELCRLEENENLFQRSPYYSWLRRIMNLISKDLYAIKWYLKKEGVQVSERPVEVTRSYINWLFWYKGRMTYTGGTPNRLKQRLEERIFHYIQLERESSKGE